MYQVRRVHIGKTPQLDELAHACGEVYSKTLVFFWRTVRHKGIWLKAKHLMRLWTSDKLHAHTSDLAPTTENRPHSLTTQETQVVLSRRVQTQCHEPL